MTKAVRRIAVVLLCLALPAAMAATIASALLPAPELLGKLREAGLIGAGERVPAFSWTLEVKRPMRDARIVAERFLGSPGGEFAGLSPMQRSHGTPTVDPAAGLPVVLSVRGLSTLRPDDTTLDVAVSGLRLPLARGAVFRLDWQDDGAQLEQTCTVGDAAPASGLHPDLPGTSHRIACEGGGSYKGIPVSVTATVFYLERLGVFVQAESTIRTPLGPLRASARVSGFSMP